MMRRKVIGTVTCLPLTALLTEVKGQLEGELLWGGGSVLPVSSISMDGDTLVVTRTRNLPRRGPGGATAPPRKITETIKARLTGAGLTLTHHVPGRNGQGGVEKPFKGRRNPTMPKAPNLKTLKFGKPIQLFNEKDCRDGC